MMEELYIRVIFSLNIIKRMILLLELLLMTDNLNYFQAVMTYPSKCGIFALNS